jgi:hypothetical protein
MTKGSRVMAAPQPFSLDARLDRLGGIDPARIVSPPGTATVADLTAADTLSGEPVLPGFALPLARLFAELDRHG